MRLSTALRIGVPIAAICLCVQGQNTPGKDAQVEAKGLPPGAAPADYQAQAGTVTIAAEFNGHSAPTLQGPLTTEDYVAIETGLFGSPGARIKLSIDDFALRINGRKTPLPSQPYGLVVGSLKDPDRGTARVGSARSKGLASARRPQPSTGRTDFLRVPGQDPEHRFDRADLRRSGRKSHPEAPAIARWG
jgi:hypothetical protein